MCYVDVAPMITAFRAHPEQFVMKPSGRSQVAIFHRRTKHHFYPVHYGRDIGPEWHLVPRCDCDVLHISSRQQAALGDAIANWRANYWEPMLALREQRAVENARRIAARAARMAGWREKVIAFVTFRWRRPAAVPTMGQTSLVGGDD